jgi:hypothetical protein
MSPEMIILVTLLAIVVVVAISVLRSSIFSVREAEVAIVTK